MNPIAAYILAIALGLLFSIAELFTKFKDDPLAILGRLATWVYVLINIAVTAGIMYLLTETTIIGQKIPDMLTASLAAGFGSAVILRSKFLKVNVGGNEVAIGPEVFVNIFLDALERRLDRERALVRKSLVEDYMADIDFTKAKTYVLTTIIASSQLESNASIDKIKADVDNLAASKFTNKEKSYALGYMILDLMGEKFLRNIFSSKVKQDYVYADPGK